MAILKVNVLHSANQYIANFNYNVSVLKAHLIF